MLSIIRSRRLFAGLLLVFFAPLLLAASVAELGTVSVPIADDSEAELARALSAAFQIVLTRLTGTHEVANLPSLGKLRSHAKQYNTLFGYARDPDGMRTLRADFDLPAIIKVLRERGVSVWGKERPEVAVWLVFTDATGRHVTPEPATREVFDSLTRQATIRAIPLRPVTYDAAGPLLGSATTEDELFAGLGALASRAGAPARLVLLIAPVLHGSGWRARWQLAIDADVQQGEATGELPIPLVVSSLDKVFDSVAQHYLQSVDTGSPGVIDLWVEGVTSADAYGRALNYLSHLDVVSRVEVLGVEGNTLTLRVMAHGGLPALAQGIGFGQILAANPDSASHYRLLSP